MHQHNLRSRGIGSEELLVGGGAEEEVMEQYTDLKAKLYNRHGSYPSSVLDSSMCWYGV